jgi:hypothetical protein
MSLRAWTDEAFHVEVRQLAAGVVGGEVEAAAMTLWRAVANVLAQPGT